MKSRGQVGDPSSALGPAFWCRQPAIFLLLPMAFQADFDRQETSFAGSQAGATACCRGATTEVAQPRAGHGAVILRTPYIVIIV